MAPLVLAILGAASFNTSFAQQDAETLVALEEIIVTARKREETLQDVPIAISALTGEQLLARGIDQFDEVLPSISNASQSGGIAGGLQGLISIRGISTLVRFVGLETGVGFYLDGVYVGRPESFNQDLIDIKRVEVLKGPQGAVFGKNTVAGAINIITETPDNEFRAKAETQFGNYDLVKARASLSGALVEDKVFGSISLGTTQRDGYVRNIFPGSQDLDDADISSGRAKLRFTPSEQAEFIFSADFLSEDSNAAFFEVREVGVPAGDIFGAETAATLETPFLVNSDQTNSLSRDVFGLSATANIELADGMWTTVLGYRDTSFDANLDDDKLPARFFADAFSSDSDFFSAETRYSASLGEKITYTVGAYYFTQDATNVSNFALGDFLTGAAGVEPPLDLTSSVETDSFAVFFNGDYALSERLTLEVGGRYVTEDKKAFHSQVDGTGIFGDVLFNADRDDDDFSPTVSLSYDVNENSTAYIRYAEGFKSAGFNTDIISPAANQEVDPESARAFEIGYKAAYWNNRIRLNAAAFTTDYEDLQVATITSSAVSLENAAQADISGFEFDVTALINQHWTLAGSFGYLDATYDDFVGCPAGGAIAVTPLPNCASNFLNLAPEYTASASAAFNYPISSSMEFNALIDWNYRSEVFFEPQNEVRLSGDSRSLLNLRMGVSTEHWDFIAWAKNLTDETYINFADDRSAILINTTESFGAPRTYGVTVRYTY